MSSLIGALGVLTSEELKSKIGANLELIAKKANRSIHWTTPNSQPDAFGKYAVDLAFISRDVTGQSTKNNLKEPLLRFYEILRHSTYLKWVHTHSAGADRPIYPELMAKGISVTTSSGANADAVAHTALGAILALGRQFKLLFQSQQDKRWTPVLNNPYVHSFKQQKVMIVGLGPIGLELAKCLGAIGMQVSGVTRDPGKYQNIKGLTKVIDFKSIQSNVSDIDYLVLACPLGEQTRALIHKDIFSAMKPNSYVVNVARGEVIVQNDLIEALKNKEILGAFLDVFELEPLDTASPLWDMPNVIISPHTAGHFSGHNAAVEDIFIRNFEKYVYGKDLINQV